MRTSWIVLLVVACGDPAPRAPRPPGPVSIGEACHSIGDKLCTTLGERCGGGFDATAQCRRAFLPRCLEGHDEAAPSKVAGPQLDACLASLDTIPCEHLMDPAQLGACLPKP